MKELEGGVLRLFTRRSGYSGVSFAVANCHATKAVEFTLDCRASTNVMSHRGNLRASVTV